MWRRARRHVEDPFIPCLGGSGGVESEIGRVSWGRSEGKGKHRWNVPRRWRRISIFRSPSALSLQDPRVVFPFLLLLFLPPFRCSSLSPCHCSCHSLCFPRTPCFALRSSYPFPCLCIWLCLSDFSDKHPSHSTNSRLPLHKNASSMHSTSPHPLLLFHFVPMHPPHLLYIVRQGG